MRKVISRSIVLFLIASFLQGISLPPHANASAGPKGSLAFDGQSASASTIMQVEANGLTAPRTGEFTYETWFKTTLDQSNPTTGNIVQTIMGTRSPSGNGNSGIDITVGGISGNGRLTVMTGGGSGPLSTGTGQVIANRWYHMAFVRDFVGDVYVTSLYLDGVLKDYRLKGNGLSDVSPNKLPFNFDLTSTRVYLGRKGDSCCGSSAEELSGFLSNVRVSNIAEYTSDFTPPTGPLVATAQTQLLLNTTNDANYLTNTGTKTGVTISASSATTRIYPVTSSDAPEFATPTLTSLSVSSGVFAGGTTSEVIGTNLSSVTGITVGGTSATGITVNSPTSVSFTTPSGTLGAKDVVVSTMLGNFTLTGAFTYVKTPQTITFGALADILISGTPPAVSATASSGLTVVFTSATTGVCTVSGTTVTLVAPGTCTINANQAGDGTYAAATQVQQSFGVSYRSQTVSFDALTGATLGVSSAPLIRGSASSGLAVTYSSTTPGVCTVSGTTISMLNPGTCTISASQAGNGTYSAAASVTQSFSITAKPDDGQKELMAILTLLPELASISKNIGDLAVNSMTKCVKGKLVKRVKKGAKCPKTYRKVTGS
jgi:hypothetical protein